MEQLCSKLGIRYTKRGVLFESQGHFNIGAKMSNTATRTPEINSTVTEFLALLAQANAVEADSPLLTNWSAFEATGEADNEVVCFSWEEEEGSFSCKLTEAGISAGQWVDNSFFCEDHEGEDVQITLYKTIPLIPGQAV